MVQLLEFSARTCPCGLEPTSPEERSDALGKPAAVSVQFRASIRYCTETSSSWTEQQRGLTETQRATDASFHADARRYTKSSMRCQRAALPLSLLALNTSALIALLAWASFSSSITVAFLHSPIIYALRLR